MTARPERRFALLLARTMGMTVEELTARMGIDEFAEHWADYLADPWGETRADLRSGIVASLLYNIHRGEGEPKGPNDYLLFQPKDPKQEKKNLSHFLEQQERQLKARRGK